MVILKMFFYEEYNLHFVRKKKYDSRQNDRAVDHFHVLISQENKYIACVKFKYK